MKYIKFSTCTHAQHSKSIDLAELYNLKNTSYINVERSPFFWIKIGL